MSANPQHKHLNEVVQPYALRAPEVILGLEWGYAIDIWSLGCMVIHFPLIATLQLYVNNPPKMYEFATGNWLFTPKAKDDISRDVIHLAQITLRTGQEHDESILEQYKSQGEKNDIKGMAFTSTSDIFLTIFISRYIEECNCNIGMH